MDIENFIAEFKKTFFYDMLKDYVTDERLFDHSIVDGQVVWMKKQARQMWSMWQAAKANAVPEGFVLVPKEPTEKMIDAGVEETSVDWKRLVFGYKAMIAAAQEPAND